MSRVLSQTDMSLSDIKHEIHSDMIHSLPSSTSSWSALRAPLSHWNAEHGDSNPTTSAYVSPRVDVHASLGDWTIGSDSFSQDPGYLASREQLRCMLVNAAQSTGPASFINDEQDNGPGGTPQAPLFVSRRNQIRYLQNYIGEVAPWLDMFDQERYFGIVIPALARDFSALYYAMLAISARQIERKQGSQQDSFHSLQLYQESIRLLRPLLELRDQKVVAACVILCCLEMMSARAQDWRRHLEGCAALFDAFGIHGFSNGLLRAVFWCYARMDVCGAMISDGIHRTLLPPSKWLPPGHDHADSRRLFYAEKKPDMHANYAVYLSAKVSELLSDHTRYTELGIDNGCTADSFQERWLRLWDDLQDWYHRRPSELLPVQTIQEKPFPRIFFVHWAAISSNQLYHASCILLLNIKPTSLKLHSNPVASALWHARRVCGISLTNPHHGCLNNATQALWIAGRLFTHRSEHEIISNLIRSIEKTTGWGMTWRIKDLEIAWGYASHQEESIDDPYRVFTAR